MMGNPIKKVVDMLETMQSKVVRTGTFATNP